MLKRVPKEASKRMKARGRGDAPPPKPGVPRGVALLEMRAASWSRLVDPARAAQYAAEGRRVPPDRLAELAGAVMDNELAEAREGRPAYSARLLAVSVQLMAIDLLEQASTGTIRPAQLPMSIRLGQQALEAMGGGKLAFSNVSLDMGGLEE